MTVHVIIVAAGSGTRFGSQLPKQFCLLEGRPVLMHAIDRMRAALPDAGITVVLGECMMDFWNSQCKEFGYESPCVVAGGATRSDSVRNALDMLTDVPDVILVHDGARPLVNRGVIENVLSAMDDGSVDGAIPAVAVTDSLRMGTAGSSVAVDRSCFYAVQTPQAFRGAAIIKAYKNECRSFSDDASLMEHSGYSRIVLTEGSCENIKITNPSDLAIAEIMARR